MRRPEPEPEDAGTLPIAPEPVDWMLTGEEEEAETSRTLLEARVLRRELRRRTRVALQEEELASFYTAVPAAGEVLHVVSNGRFDYFRFLPRTLELLGRPADEVVASTWTMSRSNVRELLALFDAGKIRRLGILTGTYFLRRESAVATQLQEGLRARGQRFRAAQVHTKVLAIAAPPDFVVVEGSANWTANPRVEQNIVANDRALFDFHREWHESLLVARKASA